MGQACAEYGSKKDADIMIKAYSDALLKQEQERAKLEAKIEQDEATVAVRDEYVLTVVISVSDAARKKLEGGLGETSSTEIAISTFKAQRTRFTPAYHGIDNVLLEPKKKLEVLDSKDTIGNPFSHLAPTKHGRQLDDEWIYHKAGLMQKESSAQYTVENAKLGKRIQQILDSENETLSVVLVHANPATGVTTVYKRESKEKEYEVVRRMKGDSDD